jgi:thiamine biosynthesis lipoprotein
MGRRILPVQVDLGGIAKGFAVDRAVEAIRLAHPDASGCVNAGGDLRVFGQGAQTVWVRSGPVAAPVLRSLPVANEAVATSTAHSADPSPYVDPLRDRPVVDPRTAVARAESCAVADALTKIAVLAPDASLAAHVASRYGAEVSVLP